MNLVEETRTLRKELAELAAEPEKCLFVRYSLDRKRIPAPLRALWWFPTQGLLALLKTFRRPAWLPSLKHAEPDCAYSTLVIWALGAEKEKLRHACARFRERLVPPCRLVPVLVTDVADFAFFSRLGWLIEYVPELSGKGPSYRERKRRYLAWRYKNALFVPMSVGFSSAPEWEEILMLHLK